MRAVLALSATLAFLATVAAAAPVHYQLPPETATLAPGPNVEVAQSNCTGCHSADYITTQPRSFPDPHAFWSAEVAKMRSAYGAPIADKDVPLIVTYLATTYGH